MNENKMLVICGPTATGKTDLAITLAKKFDGELISADSRQVYKGMDIGTGKDIEKSSKFRPKADQPLADKDQSSKLSIKNEKLQIGFREKDDIPIWLLDIVSPDYRFNVGEYRKLTELVISDIHKRDKLPIIVGGTGLYITSLLKPLEKIDVPIDISLREELEQLSVRELQIRLSKLSPKKLESMNESDRQNPRRLVRAIEILSVIPVEAEIQISNWIPDHLPASAMHRHLQAGVGDDKLLIGLTAPVEILNKRINNRVDKRMEQGIMTEIQSLLNMGYGWNLPAMSGLGYKEWKPLFEISNIKYPISNIKKEKIKQEIIELWKLHEKQYAKRQMTWFKKMKHIEWFDIESANYQNQILDLVEKWYTKKYAAKN